MPRVKVYTTTGELKHEIDIPVTIFGQTVNRPLLHRVLQARASARRAPVGHTKTRADVRGGGRKPWKQKGTGRARHSSIRSPIWKGGGVVFGPRSERVWDRKVNVKSLRKALSCALSAKYKMKKTVFVDALRLEAPKTKQFMTFWNNFRDHVSSVKASQAGIAKSGNHLLLIPSDAYYDSLNRSSKNIPGVKVVRASSLPLEDIVSYRYVVIDPETIPVIEKRCHTQSSQ